MDERTCKPTDRLGCHLWTRYRVPEGVSGDHGTVPKSTNRITMDMQGAAVLAGFIAAIGWPCRNRCCPNRRTAASSFRYVTARSRGAHRTEGWRRLDVRSSFDIVAWVSALLGDLPGHNSLYLRPVVANRTLGIF